MAAAVDVPVVFVVVFFQALASFHWPLAAPTHLTVLTGLTAPALSHVTPTIIRETVVANLAIRFIDAPSA